MKGKIIKAIKKIEEYLGCTFEYNEKIDSKKQEAIPEYNWYSEGFHAVYTALEKIEIAINGNQDLEYFLIEEKQIQCWIDKFLYFRDRSMECICSCPSIQHWGENWKRLEKELCDAFYKCITKYELKKKLEKELELRYAQEQEEKEEVILVVEDDQKIQKHIEKELFNSFSICFASKLIELDAKKIQNYNLVVLDRKILGGDAWDWAEEHLPESFLESNIILTSGCGDNTHLLEALCTRVSKKENCFFKRIKETITKKLRG